MFDISVNDFLVAQEKRGLAAATLRAFRSDLHNFRDWWEETRGRPFAVSHLTSRDLRQWQRHRQQVDGVSPRTINRNLSSLRRYCQWAVTEGLLPDVPLSPYPKFLRSSCRLVFYRRGPSMPACEHHDRSPMNGCDCATKLLGSDQIVAAGRRHREHLADGLPVYAFSSCMLYCKKQVEQHQCSRFLDSDE